MGKKSTVAVELYAALEGGPLSEDELAERLWPVEQNPGSWNRPRHGGPPAWKRTLGRLVTRYGLQVNHRAHGRRTIALPKGCYHASQLRPKKKETA